MEGAEITMKGTITRVFLPRGFGFARGDDGLDYFIQADALVDVAWDGVIIREGVRVEFLPDANGAGGNGLRATEVRLA